MSLEERKTNDIRCCDCKHSVATSSTEKVWLCDNPDLKSHGKNVRHGSKFSCGYGQKWEAQ